MCGEHPSSEACPYSCRTAMGSCSYRIEDTPPSSYTCSPVHEETEGEHTLHVPKIKIKISRDDHSIEVQNVQKRAKRDEEEELRIDEDVTSTAEELISRCKAFWAREPLRQENVTSCNILGYPVHQPSNNPKKTKKPDTLHPKTPSVLVTSQREAFGQELLDFCLSHPISVVRGLASACQLDLALYTSKTLADTWPDHPVEIRTQHFKSNEENVDDSGRSSWDCYSVRSSTTIKKYAQYQATTYLQSLKKEGDNPSPTHTASEEEESDLYEHFHPHRKFFGTHQIRFGTNVDLSDERMWTPQIKELDKLPAPFKVFSPGNMLSHVGHQILGMNTIQLYMKVKGSRTPGHQENNNFSAVNMNIGPGDCEWFAVSEDHWEDIYRLCRAHGMDYLKGSWWPDPQDCVNAGIPLYRFVQRPGDLVFINVGCVHWVQSLGWTNNIAWNVGPLTPTQYRAALERYELNKLEQFKSIVSMISLSWNIARNIRVADRELFKLIKSVLRRTLLHSVKILQFVRSLQAPVRFYGREENEATHYCELCEEEVFNTLMIKKEEIRHHVFCIKCVLQESPNLEGYMCLEEFELKELISVYNNFKQLEN